MRKWPRCFRSICIFALLDAAHIQNVEKIKPIGGRRAGQTLMGFLMPKTLHMADFELKLNTYTDSGFRVSFYQVDGQVVMSILKEEHESHLLSEAINKPEVYQLNTTFVELLQKISRLVQTNNDLSENE